MNVAPGLFTIGHSTRPIAEFLELLRAHGVQQVVDVRTIPRSRHNPQYESGALEASLAAAGLRYFHRKDLGGLRKPRADSPNRAWRNDGFRGYADYMQSAEFAQALEQLLELASQRPTAILCAEAVPWRCHRSLIADAVTARGVAVRHIMSPASARLHQLHPAARIGADGKITYPDDPSIL